MKKRINLIIIVCLLCSILFSAAAPLAAFAAVEEMVELGSLDLGVHFVDFGMVAELEGADGKICSFDPKCDAIFTFSSKEYTPFKGYSGYYYLLNAYNAEYNYEVTVCEYLPILSDGSLTKYRETNRWTFSTVSMDIDVRPGCRYSVYFTQGAAVAEGMYNTGLTEISFHLPEIYDVSSYSNVLEDLGRDNGFDMNDYPTRSYEAFE